MSHSHSQVIGAKKGVIYGFEVKTSVQPSKTFYFRDFDNIRAFLVGLQEAGVRGRGYLAVRFRGGQWRFYPIYPDVDKIKAEKGKGITVKKLR